MWWCVVLYAMDLCCVFCYAYDKDCGGGMCGVLSNGYVVCMLLFVVFV